MGQQGGAAVPAAKSFLADVAAALVCAQEWNCLCHAVSTVCAAMKPLVILSCALLLLALTACRTSQPETVTRDLARLHARAEKGSAGAQYELGRAYAEAWNAHEASVWYRYAAEQGLAEAQYALGQYYVTGEGMSRNNVEAYAWFSLAAAQQSRVAINALNKVIRQMSRAEIEEGNRRAFELITRHPAAKGKALLPQAEAAPAPAEPKKAR
jgi:hypothetical protein